MKAKQGVQVHIRLEAKLNGCAGLRHLFLTRPAPRGWRWGGTVGGVEGCVVCPRNQQPHATFIFTASAPPAPRE